ncbi:hypothetical protein FA15DRAFT_669585 [Coprinopsis marcescibilis]|uniref:Uncharacterized protein n=1 Tax=Coprinopsis marcescibilis TaxID=230819 RepID=A0A5C3KW98_COPMA|nr:hypothetical protein FA15DRAFT_669585 [Coprinopsis marcescibilis]
MDHKHYNNLPTLRGANAKFTDRDELFPKLAELFAHKGYAGVYAFGLVHRHCSLRAGERMVTSVLVPQEKFITQPEKTTAPDANVIPDRWTVNGEAFEFSRLEKDQQPTPPPPAELFKALADIVGKESVVGVYLVPNLPPGKVHLDATLDPNRRTQTVRVVDIKELVTNSMCSGIEVSWVPSTDSVVKSVSACRICDEENNHPWLPFNPEFESEDD